MQFSDQSYNLRIELDTKKCDLSAQEIRHLEQSLSPLDVLVKPFPIRDLYITIEHFPRTNEYHVKTALVLTGRTLFSRDHDAIIHPAFERCITNLVEQIEQYKNDLDRAPETAKHIKGTYHDVVPTTDPNADVLQTAFSEGDYASFRREVMPYEESLRRRVGRWVLRYPEAEAWVEAGLNLDDIVEAVFLEAFERFDRRPQNMRFGEWLETLIDTALRDMLRNPDAAMANVSFARTLQETS